MFVGPTLPSARIPLCCVRFFDDFSVNDRFFVFRAVVLIVFRFWLISGSCTRGASA
jgi:hypothetical protein